MGGRFRRPRVLEPQNSRFYRLSKEAYLNDRGSHDLAHLIFEVPRIDDTAWDANLPNTPVLGGAEEPRTLF